MPASSHSPNGGGAGLPALGPRGEGWVAAQALLLVAVALSPLVGLGWPDELETVALVVGVGLMAVGLLLVVLGAVQLGAALTPLPAPRAGAELSATGVYALVRHPIYGGLILLALGWTVVFATIVGLVFTVLLALFFELKARREETWLVDHYPAYDAYRNRTHRKLIPWVY